jgi:hypothetical protein
MGVASVSMSRESKPPSGHVFRVERARGPVWYMKYRLPDGRRVQKKLGPAWMDRGRPAAGYFTKRLGEDALREVLHHGRHAHRGMTSRPAGEVAPSAAAAIATVGLARDTRVRWALEEVGHRRDHLPYRRAPCGPVPGRCHRASAGHHLDVCRT